MLLLFLAIAIGVLIAGILISANSYDYEEFGGMISFFSTLAILGILLIGFIMLACFPFKVDDRIKMYEEENFKIEEKVKSTVQAYKNFEQETYTNLIKDAHLETLLIKYPELNSNELVKMEIETYKENSKQIISLKEQKINKSVLKFWLYFGK